MIKFSTPFKFITIFFVSALLFIVQQALSYSGGPPTGMSGAPGDSNCTSCHSGTPTSSSSDISVFTNATNGVYIPDSTYIITVRARTSGCVRFGFESTILNTNASPTKLGTLGIPSAASDVQLFTGSRDYVTHTYSGSSAIYTDSTDWSFTWVAPSTPAGDAKIYVAMNATNNSGTNSGDQIHLNNFTLPQTTNVPVATITTNVSTICQNDSIQFTASGTNNTTSYQWTFPGGTPSTSTSQSVWVKFSAGTKVCSLRVANSIMYSAYVTKSVTINPSPAANISYNSTVVLCDGDSIPLTISNVNGNTYQWSKDGNNISGATGNTYQAKLSGVYRVLVTNTGCSSLSPPVTLSFNAKPNAILTAPTGITSCSGDSIRLKANSGTNYSYYFYKDNVLQVQSLDSNYYAKASGNYYVKVFTTSGCNTTSNSLNLSFYNKPTGSITSITDSICQGDSVLLSTVTNDTIIGYQWRRNGNIINGAVSKNYFASQFGTYSIDLVTNRGCTGSTSIKVIKVNSLPATNFIDSTKVGCVYSLKIRNTGSFSFQWKLNGNVINTTDTVITASSTGFYSVVITNSSGCSISTNSLFINIANAPNATITPVANAIICSDSSGVTYQVPASGSNSYKWYKNGTLISGATQNALTIVDSGNYYVAVDNGVCVVNSSVRNVKVNPAPAANFIDSVKVGCAYSVKLRNSGNYNYEWRKNGVIFNTTDSQIVVAQSGTYSLKISNTSGCSLTTNSLVLTVPAALPDASVTPAANAVICSDSSVKYQAPTAANTTYQWFKNGTLINGATQNSLVVTDSGNYTVQVTNSFCSVTSAVRNVKVNPSPSAALNSSNTSFCPGDSATITVVPTSGATYQWRKDGSNLSNSTGTAIYPKVSGVYDVVVTLGNCAKTSITVTTTQNPLPSVPVITRNVDVLTSSTATSYQWFKNGLAISGATSQSYTVTGNGTYTVQVTNGFGCKNISAGLFVIPTGIDPEVVNNLVSAFPNPVTDFLNLNFADFGNHSVSILDASGRIILSTEINDSKASLDFNAMESGIYFVKVSSPKASQILRVVKN